MHWAYDNIKSKSSGAYPPEPLDLEYGHRSSDDSKLRGVELQRAFTATGREVRPADCGPVQVISRFGYAIRTPGRITIQQEAEALRWRDFGDDSSAYGRVRVGGDLWHGTESGYVASWISGSPYIKISTGILVFFPKGNLLYQGPLPNRQLVEDKAIAPQQLDIMAGMEYYVPSRSRKIDGVDHGMAALNFIARVPEVGSTVEVQKGQVVGWVHLVAPQSSQRMEPLAT